MRRDDGHVDASWSTSGSGSPHSSRRGRVREELVMHCMCAVNCRVARSSMRLARDARPDRLSPPGRVIVGALPPAVR